MDTLLFAYWAAIMLTLVVGLLWGGVPERLAAVWLAAASGLTLLSAHDRRRDYLSVNWPMFAVDAALLLALLWLARRADRRWVLCACGAQLVGTIGHFAKFIQHAISAFSYALLTGLWSYVIMIAILVGVVQHQRRRKQTGADPFSPISSAP